jgi:lipopolysaccharide/colanic/teichoic acid biosynthesis glycosyltransferase
MTMPDEQEDSWRRDFELWGRDAVRRRVTTTSGWDEPRRQAAVRWLREKESESERRERQMRHDMRRMLWLVVAVIGLATVSIFVALIALVM